MLRSGDERKPAELKLRPAFPNLRQTRWGLSAPTQGSPRGQQSGGLALQPLHPLLCHDQAKVAQDLINTEILALFQNREHKTLSAHIQHVSAA